MIGNIINRSLGSPSVLVPVEELLGDASGSRMPEVNPELLTEDIAQRIAEACPTSALSVERGKSEDRPLLVLNYGECIGCSHCVQAGGGALLPARKFARCGVSKEALIRRFDIRDRTEVAQKESILAGTAS